MAFHDVRLDVDVERGARGGPQFKTTVIGVGSGSEQRNQEWVFARGTWDISYGLQNKVSYSALLDFFMARRGRFHAFRFKDWTDFEAAASQLGIGDNVNVDFQLVKLYTDAASTYTRKITRPITSTIQIFVDAALQTLTTHYTIGALGVITFVTAPAPAEVVTATFEFDVPVRFDLDELNIEALWYDAAEFPEINILEIRE